MELYLDILSGKHNVWLSHYSLKTYPLDMISRIADASKALRYAIAYEELRDENK